MKSTSVLAIGLLALAAACSKKDEPRPSETNITSGPVERSDSEINRPVEVTGGTTSTGSSTDPGNVQSGGANLGTTESTSGSGAGGTTGLHSGYTSEGAFGGRDAGIVGSDSLPADRQSTQTSQPSAGQRDKKNTSTTLGDGTSGQYTGGKGSYGGKATQGTGK